MNISLLVHSEPKQPKLGPCNIIIVFHVCQRTWAEHHGHHNCSVTAGAKGGAKGHRVKFRTVPLLHGHELSRVETIKYIKYWRVQRSDSVFFFFFFFISHHNTSYSLINVLLLAQTAVLEPSAPENRNHAFSIRVCGLSLIWIWVCEFIAGMMGVSVFI